MISIDRDGDFNFALVTILPAVIAVWGLSVEVPKRGPDPLLTTICVVIAVLYLGATIWFIVEQLAEDRFRTWLLDSVAAIERGEAWYRGVPISPQTELRIFKVPIELIAFGYDVALRPRFAGYENLSRIRALSTGLGFCFGLWSWLGPFRVLGFTYANARGGRSITVAEYHARLIQSGAAEQLERELEQKWWPPFRS